MTAQALAHTTPAVTPAPPPAVASHAVPARVGSARTALRWTGAAGMLGGLIMFAGDVLNTFNAVNPAPGEIYVATQAATLGQVAPWRLVVSGALGPVGGWLYLLGAWQMYLALRSAGPRLAATTAGAFGALLVWA